MADETVQQTADAATTDDVTAPDAGGGDIPPPTSTAIPTPPAPTAGPTPEPMYILPTGEQVPHSMVQWALAKTGITDKSGASNVPDNGAPQIGAPQYTSGIATPPAGMTDAQQAEAQKAAAEAARAQYAAQHPLTPAGATVENKTTKDVFDPEAEKANLEAQSTYHEATQALVEGQIAAQKLQNDTLTNQSNKLNEENTRYTIQQNAIQDQIKQKMSDINRISDQYAQMKIDPDAFGRMDTANKIQASIGLILGGMGQGAMGLAQNPAQTALDNIIQRDIDAQKANMTKTGNLLEQSRGALGEFVNASGDMRAAEAAERSRILGVTKAKLLELAGQAEAGGNGQGLIQQRANQEAALLDAKIAQSDADSMKHVATNVTTTTQAPFGVMNKPISPTEADQISRLQTSQDEIDKMVQLAQKPNVQTAMGPVKGRFNEWKAEKGVEVDPDVAEFRRLSNSMMLNKTPEEAARISQFTTELQQAAQGGGLAQNPKNALANLQHTSDAIRRDTQRRIQMIYNPMAALQAAGAPQNTGAVAASSGIKKK